MLGVMPFEGDDTVAACAECQADEGAAHTVTHEPFRAGRGESSRHVVSDTESDALVVVGPGYDYMGNRDGVPLLIGTCQKHFWF